MKLIPNHIKNKLSQKPYLNKIINNIGWLFFDKIFRMGVGLFIGAWMARYLGPEQLGLLNYVLAIISFLVVIAGFGLNNIIVKDLVSEPKENNEILGSSFLIQITTSIFAFFILLMLSFILFDTYSSQLIAIIVGLSLLLKPIDTIRYYFEANVQSKYIVWSENISFIICSLLKVLLFLIGASLTAISWVFLLDAIIMSFLILLAYFYNNQHIFTWKINTSRIRQNIKQCWPLILSGLTVIIYMRVDQIMLGHMINYEAVGIYTAATRLSEIWYFIPMAIMASVNPILISARNNNKENYYNKLKMILNILVFMAIVIAIITSLFSHYIIYILYGKQYLQSSTVLIIHIWTGVFVCMGVATSQWFILENKQILAFYRTLYGAIINILMNFLLIPNYGVIGAAISTLIAMLCAGFLFDILNKNIRKLFWIKLSSLNITKTLKIILYNVKDLK